MGGWAGAGPHRGPGNYGEEPRLSSEGTREFDRALGRREAGSGLCFGKNTPAARLKVGGRGWEGRGKEEPGPECGCGEGEERAKWRFQKGRKDRNWGGASESLKQIAPKC